MTLTEPFKSKTTFQGTLVGRDDEAVSINLKGRLQRILGVISQVCLPAACTYRDSHDGSLPHVRTVR